MTSKTVKEWAAVEAAKKVQVTPSAPLAAIPLLAEGWISGNETPPNTNDVIAKVTDGTFFMARYYNDTKWNFYFSDTGLKPDDTNRMKVVCWLPLERLPACR